MALSVVLSASAVKRKAQELKFDVCGVAAAGRPPRLARLGTWLDRGHAGDMKYLDKSRDERLDPARVLPGVRSVISLGVIYNTDRPYSTAVEGDGRVAVSRYAWGDDYHDVLRQRLQPFVRWLADEAGPGFEAFSCVDNGPVQERVWAEQAGLGWIGKNTCLINPTLGSWLFLAEVLTNLELDADVPGVDQCGACTRCIDACPTGAIVEPYVVDAARCLSYLTIETRGPVDVALRPYVTTHVYGCDICQDVCPWNRRAATSEDPAWQPRDGLAFPSLLDLCRLSDAEWRARLTDSAMRRAGLRRIRRSLAYSAAHLSARERQTALDALASHASGRDPDVGDAIRWARSW